MLQMTCRIGGLCRSKPQDLCEKTFQDPVTLDDLFCHSTSRGGKLNRIMGIVDDVPHIHQLPQSFCHGGHLDAQLLCDLFGVGVPLHAAQFRDCFKIIFQTC